MKFYKKLLIALFIILAKTEVSISQTYVTPVVGYEWSIFYPESNLINVLGTHPFSIFRYPDKYPLKSARMGLMARRKVGSKSLLKIGTFYSKHSYFELYDNIFPDYRNKTFRRIMASVGYEYQLPSNIYFAGNLVYHYIYRITGYRMSGLMGNRIPGTRYYRANRQHLSFEVNIGYTYKNVLLQLHYDLGIVNLYDTEVYSATTPINGFGVSLGYQFEF